MKVINLSLGQKAWKAFKEKSRIIVHLHIAIVRTLRKTLITMWHRRCAKSSYSRQGFVQDSRALKALAFRAACVEYPSSMLARFRVRERNYLSVRFIFRICEVRELLAVIDSLVLRQESGRPLQLWGIWNEACFPEAFYKCSNNLFALSEILGNGLLCGGVRRKWSMAALMDFAIRAIVLPRRCVKKTSTVNIQFFLSHFLYRLWNLVAPGLASHSVEVNIVFAT